MTTIIETERLILRTWEKEDAKAYFQINQDPKVTEFLLGPLAMEQITGFIEAMNSHSASHGYTIWAACLKETSELIGFIGLKSIDWKSHFTPAVEIAWRLGAQYWGKGYATEGAKATVKYGFNQCGLEEILSFTVPDNIRSLQVMQKIGLKHDIQGSFEHPELPVDHPLSQHVLYRLTKEDYLKAQEIR